MKFYNTTIEEQETTINIIYDEKCLYIYSSRKAIIERLIKKLGKLFITNWPVSFKKWKGII